MSHASTTALIWPWVPSRMLKDITNHNNVTRVVWHGSMNCLKLRIRLLAFCCCYWPRVSRCLWPVSYLKVMECKEHIVLGGNAYWLRQDLIITQHRQRLKTCVACVSCVCSTAFKFQTCRPVIFCVSWYELWQIRVSFSFRQFNISYVCINYILQNVSVLYTIMYA